MSKDYATSRQGEDACPRCGEGPLKAWYELSEEERELARRRFCTRCWHEEQTGSPRTA